MRTEGFKVSLDKKSGSHSPRKFSCPACGKKRFVRYWDSERGEYLPDSYGKCDRIESCGYWQKPGPEYFRQPEPPPSRIEAGIFHRTLKAYDSNHLFVFLSELFSRQVAQSLLLKYYVGTTRDGAAIFWQMDEREEIRSGKIMKYGTDGHRTGNTDWIHSRMERLAMIPGFELEQCFFGQHLLSACPQDKPIAIVESEKTALIANEYLADYVWLAAGSANGMGGKSLNRSKCSVLAGRDVMLFPDLTSPESKAERTCFDHWQQIADLMNEQLGTRATISPFLEGTATDEMKRRQWDLADYLVWANVYAPERKQFVIASHLINYTDPMHRYYMPF